jgi:hypothetical protein
VDLLDGARGHGPAALSDGEAQTGLQRNRLPQGHRQLGAVAREQPVASLGEPDVADHVAGSQKACLAMRESPEVVA